MPKITAIIPTYNRAGLLVEALDSALQQTRPPDEILVIDDGSTDDTQQVISRYGEKVRYIRQKNAGPSAARNHGIRIASCDFIAFLDSDDLWAKDRLAKQLIAIDEHPDLDLLFGLESKFSAQGQLEPCAIKNQEVLASLNSSDVKLSDPFSLLLFENYIPTSSALFRKTAISQVGFIDETINQSEDYDFWLRFALHGFKFGFINAVLCHRRMHAGNLVNEWAARTASTANVLTRYIEQAGPQRARVTHSISAMHYDLGSHFLYRRDFVRALHFLRMANPTGGTRVFRSLKLACAYLLSHF